MSISQMKQLEIQKGNKETTEWKLLDLSQGLNDTKILLFFFFEREGGGQDRGKRRESQADFPLSLELYVGLDHNPEIMT